MLKKSFILIGLLTIFLLFIFIQEIVLLYTDYLWFEQFNYLETFWTLFLSKFQMQSAFSLFFAFIFLTNFIFLKIFISKSDITSAFVHEFRTRFQNWEKILNHVVFGFLLIFLSYIMGNQASGHWQDFLLAWHGQSFDLVEPIFNLDVSFYVFQMPIVSFVGKWLFSSIVIIIVFSLLYCIMMGSVRINNGISIDKNTWAHLSFLVGLLIILVGAIFKLNAYQIMYSDSGVVFGPGYTQYHALVFGYNTMAIFLIVAGLILWFNIYQKKISVPIFTILFVFIIGIALLVIYPNIIQKFIVEPNELKSQSPFIAHNIAFTQKAYQLDHFNVQKLPIKKNVDPAKLPLYQKTLKNIRLWDYRPLKQTFSQLQEIRLYYQFHDVDIDRYNINSEQRLVMLSGRELETNDLPDSAKTWINRHMKYTHGYGVVVAPVNEVTQDGLPQLMVRDIPPKTDIPELTIDRPEIYYGERTNHYVLSGSKELEFDYPMGDKNAYNRYNGSGGILVDSLLRRIAFALRFKTTKILFARGISDQTRIMFHRNIKTRVHALCPLLQFDSDPYLVIADKRLFYILDGYTTTNRFPYSAPFSKKQGYNYIRNSVKVVIDAYNGSVDFYRFDETDPIIDAFTNIFPGLFKTKDSFPEHLINHIRYPATLFDIQMDMYRNYHMADIQVFYNKEDLWEFPFEIYENKKILMESYYQIMKLPNMDGEHFALMRTFTPRGKNNLIAMAAALSAPEQYGQIIIYKLPKQELAFGPMQFEARVDQEPEISRQLSLWSQKGSRVIRGNTLIIPIDNTLLYVEPLFLRAEQSELPELRRVILSHGSTTIMEEELNIGLSKIFGDSEFLLSEQEIANQPIQITGNGLIDKQSNQDISDILEKYQQAKELLNTGDLQGYAQKMQEFETLLERINNR